MEIIIKPATQEKINAIFSDSEDYSSEDWLDVTCNNITPDGAIFCAIQFCTDAVLYYPNELSTEIYQKFSDAANLYKNLTKN